MAAGTGRTAQTDNRRRTGQNLNSTGTNRSGAAGRSAGRSAAGRRSGSTGSGRTAPADAGRRSTEYRRSNIPDRGYNGHSSRRSYDDENNIRRDMIIIILFAVMIFLFLSNFGILGPVGTVFSNIMFGLFGLTAYIFPVFVFGAVLFYYANLQEERMPVKLGAAITLFLVLGIICELAAGRISSGSGYDLADLYISCSEHRNGGGVIAGSLAWLFHALFRTFGTVLILIIATVICVVLLTQRSLIDFVGDTAENARKRHEERMRELEEEARYMEDAGGDPDASYMDQDSDGARTLGFSHRSWTDRLRERQEERQEKRQIWEAQQEEERRRREARQDALRRQRAEEQARKRTAEEQARQREQLHREAEENDRILRPAQEDQDRVFRGVQNTVLMDDPYIAGAKAQLQKGSGSEAAMAEGRVRAQNRTLDRPVNGTGEGTVYRNTAEASAKDTGRTAAPAVAQDTAELHALNPEGTAEPAPENEEEVRTPEGAQGLHELQAEQYDSADTLLPDLEEAEAHTKEDETPGADPYGRTEPEEYGDYAGEEEPAAYHSTAFEDRVIGHGLKDVIDQETIGSAAGTLQKEAVRQAATETLPEEAGEGHDAEEIASEEPVDYSQVPMLQFIGDEAVPTSPVKEETPAAEARQAEAKKVHAADGREAETEEVPAAADEVTMSGDDTEEIPAADDRLTEAEKVHAADSREAEAEEVPAAADADARDDQENDTGAALKDLSDAAVAGRTPEEMQDGGEDGKPPAQLLGDHQKNIPVHKDGVTQIADRIVPESNDALDEHGPDRTIPGEPEGAEEENQRQAQKKEKPVAAPAKSAPAAAVKSRRPYVFPPIGLLKKGPETNNADSANELRETAMKLQNTLHTFGVNVRITDISQGPAVTRYEMQPEQGVKVSKIVSLQDDIKLALAATDIRIEAPIPGKSAVGIEVPNRTTNMVALRDILDSPEFRNAKSRTAFGVGKDIAGKTVVADIAKMPHLLIAGATGSGKSVCINTIIMSILYHSSPEEVKLIMIDPKVVELSVYNGIPHLLLPVVTDSQKAAKTLNWCVAEMEERFHRFADAGVRDIRGYNAMVEKEGRGDGKDAAAHPMPHIVIIVDELADLMMVAKNEVETAICRLAQLARAAGMHLIIATQRPSVDVITGLIKANMPSRIAFAVTQGVDSRTILDMNGAEKLLGKGDMLFFPQGLPKPLRIQGAFVSDEEVTAVVDFLKKNDPPQEDAAAMQQKLDQIANSQDGQSTQAGQVQEEGRHGPDIDELFTEAGKFIIEKNSASIGLLQRRFRIGFNRAARIMDQLSEQGVVSDAEGTKPRKILMTEAEFAAWCEENL